jgi:hypothetical protein
MCTCDRCGKAYGAKSMHGSPTRQASLFDVDAPSLATDTARAELRTGRRLCDACARTVDLFPVDPLSPPPARIDPVDEAAHQLAFDIETCNMLRDDISDIYGPDLSADAIARLERLRKELRDAWLQVDLSKARLWRLRQCDPLSLTTGPATGPARPAAAAAWRKAAIADAADAAADAATDAAALAAVAATDAAAWRMAAVRAYAAADAADAAVEVEAPEIDESADCTYGDAIHGRLGCDVSCPACGVSGARHHRVCEGCGEAISADEIESQTCADGLLRCDECASVAYDAEAMRLMSTSQIEGRTVEAEWSAALASSLDVEADDDCDASEPGDTWWGEGWRVRLVRS